mgnify:CR=1 FL=1
MILENLDRIYTHGNMKGKCKYCGIKLYKYGPDTCFPCWKEEKERSKKNEVQIKSTKEKKQKNV